MSWIKDLIAEECEKSPEFKAAYDEESALLALVRARNAAKLSQRDLAETLHVSQPYIAQVERGSKPMSLSLMVRYANAVGASIEVKPKKRTKRQQVHIGLT
jgi:transcriptional regulator with XRE-family HTH domain